MALSVAAAQEEMEGLLAAVKDSATGRTVAADSAAVENLIGSLRGGSASPPAYSPVASPREAAPAAHTSYTVRPSGMMAAAALADKAAAAVAEREAAASATRAAELDLLRRKLEEDNGRLKSELHAAKRMLTDRLR
jgi:hypothetical protein